ncbi:MAG: threonine synthase, partial [Chloroflexi bacterium]|nr:threonine synthase [Chloroflexota bacterium]
MPGIIERFRPYLDLPLGVDPITLSEGNTPLISMPRLASDLGAAELHIKFEGSNPTGSFKDRGMTTAITEAVSRGASAVICASTGNTAASAAAYAARAGLRCVVLLPHGGVASGKLAAAYTHGAEVVEVEGSFDQALGLARRLSERAPIGLVNSLNPYRLEGQKTAAFEITEALGGAPDWLALPVGNAGNISAYWMGYRQLADLEGGDLPHFLGVQARGSAPLVEGHVIEHPETVASAIRIGNPARGEQALTAAEESGGRIIAVPDRAILEAQRFAGSKRHAKIDPEQARIPEAGSYRASTRSVGDPDDIERLADILVKSERPCVLFGSQVWTCRATEAARAFARALNIPAYLNGAGRGTFPPGDP